MRRFLIALLLLLPLLAFADGPEKGRLVKMLPLLLDTNSVDALSPSLYDRDAYQAVLRQHPAYVSGIRFDFLWQVANPTAAKYTLRVEIRGIGPDSLPTQRTLELETAPPLFRRWESLKLAGADYKKFGALVAWRATLWRGDRLLSEQKSFLW